MQLKENSATETVPLRWLYIDFNSYFASVEQQRQPELRGKPIAVMAADTDATCAIAASYEAKAYGIKTGTPIYEARTMCPGLICVQANHEAYVDYHARILAEVERHVPIAQVCSIDEVACHLLANESACVEALADAIKTGLRQHVGEYIRCSIGVAPNKLLAKIATDMRKPDGFTILLPNDLPHALYTLALSDIPGIGYNMQKRLARAGVWTMQQLLALSRESMRQIWGGVMGERMWYGLRGVHIPDSETKRSSIGHSHILAPELRVPEQAYFVAKRLTLKAASRLRRMEYYAGGLSLSMRFDDGDRVESYAAFSLAQDSLQCLATVRMLWHELMHLHPARRIKKVSVTLHKLVPHHSRQQDLFEASDRTTALRQQRAEKVSVAMDSINKRFGRDSIVMGMMPSQGKSFAGTKVAFTRIPDAQEFFE